ncbi:uncharacterized protein LOC142224061 [Haematobia irritans]|uniref:uncharacterized protein LOC142224061 n=1 Tax=Haematobia irritans TaxID=7368 RepID=UPI003F4F7B82
MSVLLVTSICVGYCFCLFFSPNTNLAQNTNPQQQGGFYINPIFKFIPLNKVNENQLEQMRTFCQQLPELFKKANLLQKFTIFKYIMEVYEKCLKQKQAEFSKGKKMKMRKKTNTAKHSARANVDSVQTEPMIVSRSGHNEDLHQISQEDIGLRLGIDGINEEDLSMMLPTLEVVIDQPAFVEGFQRDFRRFLDDVEEIQDLGLRPPPRLDLRESIVLDDLPEECLLHDHPMDDFAPLQEKEMAEKESHRHPTEKNQTRYSLRSQATKNYSDHTTPRRITPSKARKRTAQSPSPTHPTPASRTRHRYLTEEEYALRFPMPSCTILEIAPLPRVKLNLNSSIFYFPMDMELLREEFSYELHNRDMVEIGSITSSQAANSVLLIMEDEQQQHHGPQEPPNVFPAKNGNQPPQLEECHTKDTNVMSNVEGVSSLLEARQGVSGMETDDSLPLPMADKLLGVINESSSLGQLGSAVAEQNVTTIGNITGHMEEIMGELPPIIEDSDLMPPPRISLPTTSVDISSSREVIGGKQRLITPDSGIQIQRIEIFKPPYSAIAVKESAVAASTTGATQQSEQFNSASNIPSICIEPPDSVVLIPQSQETPSINEYGGGGGINSSSAIEENRFIDLLEKRSMSETISSTPLRSIDISVGTSARRTLEPTVFSMPTNENADVPINRTKHLPPPPFPKIPEEVIPEEDTLLVVDAAATCENPITTSVNGVQQPESSSSGWYRDWQSILRERLQGVSYGNAVAPERKVRRPKFKRPRNLVKQMENMKQNDLVVESDSNNDVSDFLHTLLQNVIEQVSPPPPPLSESQSLPASQPLIMGLEEEEDNNMIPNLASAAEAPPPPPSPPPSAIVSNQESMTSIAAALPTHNERYYEMVKRNTTEISKICSNFDLCKKLFKSHTRKLQEEIAAGSIQQNYETFEPEILFNIPTKRLNVQMNIIKNLVQHVSFDFTKMPCIQDRLSAAMGFSFALELKAANLISIGEDGCTWSLL